MTAAMPHILAADDGLVKLILGVVFLVFWAIGAASTAMAKKKQQEQRDRVRQAAETPAPAIPVQKPIPAPRRLAPAPRPAAKRQPPMPVKRAPAGRRAPAAAAPKVAAVPAAKTEVAPASVVVRRLNTVTATALHAWMNPATLRRQFILTEVLQPPLGLRE